MTIVCKETSQKIIKTVLASISMLSMSCLMACNSTESLKKEFEEKQQAQEERFNAKIKALEKQLAALSTPKNKKKGAKNKKGSSDAKAKKSTNNKFAGNTTIKNLDPFTINLRDPSGAKTLEMVISLEVKPAAEKALENPETINAIRDSIILFGSEFTAKNLDGLEGKMGLRDGIDLRINSILSPQKIERVYFTKFIY